MQKISLSALLILTITLICVEGIVDRTYFTYLGLTIEASSQQIQEAYQAKSIKLAALPEGEEKTKKLAILNEAYKILINNQEKDKYQRYGKESKNIKAITSINPWSKEDSRKDQTLKIQIPVSIQDIYFGTTIKASFLKTVACDACKGTGAESPKNLKPCPLCAGKGFKLIDNPGMNGQVYKTEQICSTCKGHGHTVSKHCPVCQGAKIQQKLISVEVPIPQGLPDGNVIKINNFGPEKLIGAPSNLEVTIVEIPSKGWSRKGFDSFYVLDIGLEESIFGFNDKQFKNLDGNILKVSVSETVKKQQKIVLQGQGFLNPKTNKRGSLTVSFRVNIPNFNDDQLDAWEDFFKRNQF